jgi:predicted site-specific integrase-resolvase
VIEKINNSFPVLLTTKEVAESLRIKSATLTKWRSQGTHRDLPWIKIGSRCFYEEKTIKAFISKNTTGF